MVDRLKLMTRLGQGLQQASAARDWQALARLDTDLAAALRQWRDQGPALSAAESGALQTLRSAHEQARLHCSAELDNLGQTLAQMRAGQGRWQAYAESTNWDDSAHDAKATA